MARFASRDEALDAFAVVLAHICADLETQTPEQIAEAAWRPGDPYTKAELCERARAMFAAARARQSFSAVS